MARLWPIKDWWIVLWALEKFRGKPTSGRPAYNIPSGMDPGFGNCPRCHRDLEPHEVCGCECKATFTDLDELGRVLLDSNYSEEYVIAILFCFLHGASPKEVAEGLGISYRGLRKAQSVVRNRMEALLR